MGKEKAMAQLVRCRSCGYIIYESRVGDVCPACGVPRKMLEPWNDPISPKRRGILDLGIHPIILHFAISFTAGGLALSLFLIVFPSLFHGTAAGAARVLISVLPLILIATFVSGRVDGKIRFKKAKSPLLRRKTVITLLLGPSVQWVPFVDAGLLACGLACAFLLGRMGHGLLGALFPG
jgi:ribosomal protein L37E